MTSESYDRSERKYRCWSDDAPLYPETVKEVAICLYTGTVDSYWMKAGSHQFHQVIGYVGRDLATKQNKNITYGLNYALLLQDLLNDCGVLHITQR